MATQNRGGAPETRTHIVARDRSSTARAGNGPSGLAGRSSLARQPRHLPGRGRQVDRHRLRLRVGAGRSGAGPGNSAGSTSRPRGCPQRSGIFPKRRVSATRGRWRKRYNAASIAWGPSPTTSSCTRADWGCWWSDEVAPGALLPNSELLFEDAPVLQVLAESAAAHGFCWGISGNNALQLARVAQKLRPARVLVAKQWDLLWRSADAFFQHAGAADR